VKRLDKLARSVLLPKAEYAVDDDDSDNGPADLREPSGESKPCGRPQQQGEGMGYLTCEQA
jgi:hypothetical protein